MAELPAGTVLGGRFELLGVLGRGGMATVYLAQDRLREQKVALKLLHPHLAAQPGARARLRRELQAATLLRHPGALLAHELHELDGHHALSLPFHPGQTLGERVASQGALEPEALQALGLRLAEVLVEAHRVGVLHRDITPSNVLVDDQGVATLTDFGLARLRGAQSTRSAQGLGTAGHAAPEVYAGVRGDPRSDLYSLGTVLYLAATGRTPFAADSPVASLQRQLAGSFTPLEELRPELPEALRATIEALLDADPERRPQGAAELLALLQDHQTPATPGVPRALERRVALPEGTWSVVVRESRERHRKRRRRERMPRELQKLGQDAIAAADGLARSLGASAVPSKLLGEVLGGPEARVHAAVAETMGLEPEQLERSRVLELRTFRLIAGVDSATAATLAEATRAAGMKAHAEQVRENTGWLAELLGYGPMLIPVLWVAFAFFVASGGNPLIALPFAIGATLVLPGAARRFGATGEPLPLAYPLDPSPASTEEAPPSLEARPREASSDAGRSAQLGARALRELDALEQALQERREELPEPAIADLRGTCAELRDRVHRVLAEARSLELELERGAPPEQELDWLEGRLERLRTLEHAGQPADPEEKARLEQALLGHREALDAVEVLETRFTTALAQLLEVAAVASRARRQLLTQEEAVASAERLVGRLQQELTATEDALDESSRRRAAQQARRQRS